MNFMRIRIQLFSNCGSRLLVSDPGFWWQKFKNFHSWKLTFFLKKLQFTSKHEKIFAFLDPDPATKISADPCGCGCGSGSRSETLIRFFVSVDWTREEQGSVSAVEIITTTAKRRGPLYYSCSGKRTNSGERRLQSCAKYQLTLRCFQHFLFKYFTFVGFLFSSCMHNTLEEHPSYSMNSIFLLRNVLVQYKFIVMEHFLTLMLESQLLNIVYNIK